MRAAAGEGISVSWISDAGSFARLASEWDSLADQTDAQSIFLRHGWFQAVWRWRSGDASLAILCVRLEGRLVGLVPLLSENRRRRSLRLRCLSSFDIPDTQQWSILAAPEHTEPVAHAAVRELLHTRRSRDWLQLRKLSSTGANGALLKALQNLPQLKIDAADTCPCVDLRDSWDKYYSRRSRRLKKGNNLIANRLKKAFRSVEIARTILDGSTECAMLITELCELSALSWKKDLETALHMPGPHAWAEGLRRAFGGLGEACAWTLRLDGVLAAHELQLDHAGVVSALRADTREEFDQHGAGTYLGWKILESIMGRPSQKIYNMGPGLSEYKNRWAEHYQQLSVVDWLSPTLAGRLVWNLDYRLKPLLKRFTQREPRNDQP